MNEEEVISASVERTLARMVSDGVKADRVNIAKNLRKMASEKGNEAALLHDIAAQIERGDFYD